MDQILDQVRASPVVHADETGWRQDGHNGYVWTCSTPTHRYFLRRNRSKAVVDEALGDATSALVYDFYAAYHHYDGPMQRCWAHLLRDIHDLRSLYPDDAPLARWADAVHEIYDRAKAFTHPQTRQLPRPGSGTLPNWLWRNACWPSARPSSTTPQQPRPSCADASSATSRNSLSS